MLREMVRVADVAWSMHTAGLVKTTIAFARKQPELISVKIRAAGRRALEEQSDT